MVLKCIGLAELGVDVGLLRGDVSCRGRIGLGDGQGLSSAVLCCRVFAGLGEWGLPCARSHYPVVPTLGKGQELLVMPCVCPGFAGLVECGGRRERGVGE